MSQTKQTSANHGALMEAMHVAYMDKRHNEFTPWYLWLFSTAQLVACLKATLPSSKEFKS
jgi:hypothetical protein